MPYTPNQLNRQTSIKQLASRSRSHTYPILIKLSEVFGQGSKKSVDGPVPQIYF